MLIRHQRARFFRLQIPKFGALRDVKCVCGTNPVTEFRSWCGALLLADFAGPSLCLDCDTAVQWRYSPLSFTTGAANFTTVSGALVRDADYSSRWKVAHGYISGRPSSQKRGSWVCLLAPFQMVSENRLHKLHKTNDRVTPIWPSQKVYLRRHKITD